MEIRLLLLLKMFSLGQGSPNYNPLDKADPLSHFI